MPKTRWSKPKRDTLLELVLGRKSAMHLSEESLAEKLGLSRTTLRKRLNEGSDSWSLGELKSFCRVLDISADEMRGAIRM